MISTGSLLSSYSNLNVLMYTLGCLKYVSKMNRKEIEEEVKLMKARSVGELITMIANDESLEKEIKNDPIKAIAKEAGHPLEMDKWIYRIVVLMLGLTVLLAAYGAIYLAGIAKAEIPDILIAIGSAAVGALAGLLTPTPGRE